MRLFSIIEMGVEGWFRFLIYFVQDCRLGTERSGESGGEKMSRENRVDEGIRGSGKTI